MSIDPQAYGQPPVQPSDPQAYGQPPALPDLGDGVVADQQDPTARPESLPPAPGPDPSVSAKVEAWHAVEALSIAAKAFSTGDPLFIEAQRARDFAHGAFYIMQGLAVVDPPRPVDPNLAQADQTRAAAAALQDHQAQEKVQSTERIAEMNAAAQAAARSARPAAANPVGRPSGQTKPVTSKQ